MATRPREIESTIAYEDVLHRQSLRTLFQPIVRLNESSPDIYALEALTRGPLDTRFQSAGALFGTAESKNRLHELEALARELAIERFTDRFRQDLLFINLDPNVIYDQSFQPGETLELLDQTGLDRDQIVFEITEHNEVKDREAFEDAVLHYRQQGFRLAVDDVGAGYANLDKIAQLQPSFMKIDMSIVQGLHLSQPQKKLVETLVDFADRIDSRIIAEGIENEQELRTIRSMGVDMAQGFFLAKPRIEPEPLHRAMQDIPGGSEDLNDEMTEAVGDLSELAAPAKQFPPDTLTRDVYDYFDDNPDRRCVTIVKDQKPVGLLMRSHLHQKLSTNTGQSLYWERPVSHVMNEDPLTLSADTDVKNAAKLVIDRHDENLYDEVIAVDPENKRYHGNVTVKQLLEKITQFETQKARRANPLTGLPGNIEIRDQLQFRLDQDRNFALIYVDLDHFKPFNDYYGFERGDEAILLLRDLLKDALQIHPDEMNFIGHIGGDDFVVMTGVDQVEDYCDYVTDQFDERIRQLYDPEDLNEGFIQTKNRKKEVVKFDIMTVSLAVVTNEDRSFESHLEMSEVAAEVKKYVKRDRNRSTYEIDRRSCS